MSITFNNVTKKFGSKTILKNVNFTIEDQETVFILGKSGAGKSVTLKHIVGSIKPDEGSVQVNQFFASQISENDKPKLRALCGMVYQYPALFDYLTIKENILFGLKTNQYRNEKTLTHSPLNENELKDILEKVMTLTELPKNILDKYPHEIAFGTQKCVSIARTLAPDPKILLFDEPTTSLDPIATEIINELILSLSKHLQVTSVVISHDMKSALKCADRILFLDEAKILFNGTPKSILSSKEIIIERFLREVKEAQSG